MSDATVGSRREAPSVAPALPMALGLFVAAFALRALPFPRVFTPDRIEFLGFDAYYHMRKVLYGVARFPDALDFDPYLKFPHGARPIWTPVFDTLVAWLAWPFGAIGGTPGVETFAAFVPPLLGAMTVVGTWALARRLADDTVAWVAGALLAVFSAHSWYSQIGFVDHHAAVAALSVALFAAAVPLLRAGAAEGLHGWRTGAVFGAIAALSLAVWPGMLAHLGLIEAALWIHAASRGNREQCGQAAARLAAAHTTAAVLLAPIWFTEHATQWSPYSSVVLSRFQPWFAGWLALTAVASTAVWRRTAAGRTTLTRVASCASIGALLLAASLAWLPELAAAVADAWRWISKDEVFQASVAESQPLFMSQGAVQTFIAELRFSRAIYLFPFALAAWCFSWRSRPERDRASWLAIAVWAAGLGALTLLQRRFMNSFSIPFALVMAWAGVGLTRNLAARLPPGRPARAAFAVGVTLAVAVAAAPMRTAYTEAFGDLTRWWRGAELPPQRTKAQKLPTLLAGEWLRANTPGTSGFFDATASPEYGLLSLWGDGHVLRYTARRAVVTDNFGDDLGAENVEQARRYFEADDESEADAILAALRVRYVVVRGLGSARGAHFDELYRHDGSGLSRHRLVFETPRTPGGGDRPPAKIFERVPGAVISGSAEPGSLVTASLGLRTGSLRLVGFEISTLADAAGRYALRVPHATEAAAGVDVRATGAYRVRSTGAEGRAFVSEFDVQEGRNVVGPALGS